MISRLARFPPSRVYFPVQGLEMEPIVRFILWVASVLSEGNWRLSTVEKLLRLKYSAQSPTSSWYIRGSEFPTFFQRCDVDACAQSSVSYGVGQQLNAVVSIVYKVWYCQWRHVGIYNWRVFYDLFCTFYVHFVFPDYPVSFLLWNLFPCDKYRIDCCCRDWYVGWWCRRH